MSTQGEGADRWRRSTRSANAANCVEVCIGPTGVEVRDSKDRDGPVLTYTHSEWRAFLAGAVDGEFDLPATTN
jgi:hypothetical protein